MQKSEKFHEHSFGRLFYVRFLIQV